MFLWPFSPAFLPRYPHSASRRENVYEYHCVAWSSSSCDLLSPPVSSAWIPCLAAGGATAVDGSVGWFGPWDGWKKVTSPVAWQGGSRRRMSGRRGREKGREASRGPRFHGAFSSSPLRQKRPPRSVVGQPFSACKNHANTHEHTFQCMRTSACRDSPNCVYQQTPLLYVVGAKVAPSLDGFIVLLCC